MPLEPASAPEIHDNPLAWTNRRILWLLAMGTLIVSGLWHLPQEANYLSTHAGKLFFMLVMAMAFTYLLRPPVNWIHRRVFNQRKGSRTWATLVVFIGGCLICWLFISIGLRPVTRDVQALWNWFVAQGPDGREQLISRWQDMLQQAIAPYRDYLPDGADLDLRQLIKDTIAQIGPALRNGLKGAQKDIGFIVELLLLPVLVFYFLSDGRAIRNETRLLVPAEYRERVGRVVNHLDRILDGYIRGQVIMCVIAWFAVTIGLALLGVQHAFTLGLIAGVTRAVPVIGPLLGGIPLVLVCLITTKSIPVTMTLLTGFIIMHFVESKLLLPKIVGHEVDLHPVSVIIVLLLGLEFFGFLGVFLSVPVAATLKALLAEWHEARLDLKGSQLQDGREPDKPLQEQIAAS